MPVVYLVERIQQMQINGRATYWAGCSDLVPGGETNDPWDACWFARKQDAARVAVDKFGKNLARAGWQIIEHSFETAKPDQPNAFPADAYVDPERPINEDARIERELASSSLAGQADPPKEKP